MEMILSGLCVLAIVLLVVAVVGHGLWLAGAWFLRVISGETRPPHPPGRPCPSCGRVGTVMQGRCIVCGAVPAITVESTLRQELEATARHLERLWKRGVLKPEEYGRLIDSIRADFARLAEQEAPRPARPAAPAAPAQPASAAAAARAEVVDAIVVEAPPVMRPAAPAAAAPIAPAAQLRPMAAAGQVHPLDREQPQAAPPPKAPSAPARTLADMLQSFMEESNIRWGEVIAGVLIVVCAIGLVISLRATLKNIPYFPALLFMVFTVAFHGAGLYSLRRWNLHAISRVVLIIALLLVPLGFSAGIVLSERQYEVTHPLFYVALGIGTLAFGWVTVSAARETVGKAWWRLSLAVMGSSLAQVFVSRLAGGDVSLARTSLLAALPLTCFLVASGGQVLDARAHQRLHRVRVVETLLVLGLAFFSLLVPLALMVHLSKEWRTTIAQLSPTISVAAAAILAAGLAIHNRTLARSLAPYRLAGTTIAIAGAITMLGMVALAWPQPDLLVAVGAANCLLLFALAAGGGIAPLYAGALACGALACIVATHLVTGHLGIEEVKSRELLVALLTCRSGIVLSLLAAVVGAAGWQLSQRGRREEGVMFLGSAGVFSLLSALLAAFVGFVPAAIWRVESAQDALWAAPLLVVHAVVLLAAAPLVKHPAAALGGSALLWLGLVHATAWNETSRHMLEVLRLLPDRPVLCATLVHSVLTALAAVAVGWRGAIASREEHAKEAQQPPWESFVAPLSLTSALALAGALPFILWIAAPQLYWHAAYAIWGAIVCLALVLIWRHPAAFASLQAMAALAAGIFAAAICRSALGPDVWQSDWRHFDAQLAVIAAAAAAWSGLRWYSRRWPTVREIVAGAEVSVDQGLLAIAAIAAPMLAIVGVWPGVLHELDVAGAVDASLASSTASAGGIGDWLAIGAIVGALAMLAACGRPRDLLAGLIAVLFAVPWLVAGWFADTAAVASAARWLAGGYVALFAAASLGLGRGLRPFSPQVNLVLRHPAVGLSTFALGLAAILGLTIAAVVQSLRGVEMGPAADSIFTAMRPTASFGVPLIVLVGVSLAYSVAWRQSAMSVTASLLFQLAANLAFLVHLSGTTLPVPARWAEWLQWNSLALGIFGLIWSAIELWKTRRAADAIAADRVDLAAERIGNQTQLALCGLTVLALAVWAAAAVVIDPSRQLLATPQLGSWLSYAAVGVALGLLAWRSRGDLPHAADGMVALAAMLVVFIAATSDAYDPKRTWLAYHVLTGGTLGVSLLAAIWHSVGRLAKREASSNWLLPTHWAAAILAAAVVMLAMRAGRIDPQSPWWPAGAALGSVVIFNGLGLVRRSQDYAYVGTALAVVPAFLYMIDPVTILGVRNEIFWEVCTLAPLVVAGVWLAAEIRVQRREERVLDPHWPLPPVHHVAVVIGLASMFLSLAWRLVMGLIGEFDSPGMPIIAMNLAVGLTLLVLFGLLAAMLWDRRAWHSLACQYFCGLLWIAFGLHLLRWLRIPPGSPELMERETYAQLLVAAGLAAIGGYVALTGELWKRGALLSVLGARLGISDPVAGLSRTANWLPPVSLILTIGTSVASFFAANCLAASLWPAAGGKTPGLELRTIAALAPAIAAWGIARQAQQWRESPFQMLALALAGFSAVYLGWAQLPSVVDDPMWMTRVFRLLMVLSALTFIYGLALPRLVLGEGTWQGSSRRAGYGSAVLAVTTFVAILVMEVAMFEPRIGNGVDGVQVVAVAVVLLALVAGLISLALFVDRDPLGLSETGKMGYVYAAEAVVSLLFVHLYLCRPMWFDTFLRPYWPYIVMGIAFAGVGAGEIFTRLRLRVLAEPLRNTGALMPLLPAIAMWVIDSSSDYALLLFLAGLMYLVISVTQRSWIAAAAAGAAGNGALWTLLKRGEFDITQNPQFWLIPPAVSVLVAAHINRHRLDPKLLAAIRYAAGIVIYLSSTSEIFLRGIETSLWPPMLLLGLSLAGALAGIMFRIRAFLYLGAGFTLMSLVTMVWHASRAINEIWPWWAFGIGLGIALLVLFALFEKRRDDVQALVARLRQWEQ